MKTIVDGQPVDHITGVGINTKTAKISLIQKLDKAEPAILVSNSVAHGRNVHNLNTFRQFDRVT